MATKSKSGEEEPERVVDPPEASVGDTKDTEAASEQQWVAIDQSGALTLPSGASYAFNAGHVMQLSAEDAAFVIEQGYGSEMEAPSEE